MAQRSLKIEIETFPIRGSFTIARGAKTEAVVVAVTLSEDESSGRGECVPYARYGETPESVVRQIEGIRSKIEGGVDCSELQRLLPRGAARNAVDCALWDLEAKKTGIPARVKAQIKNWRPLPTAFTISLGTPEKMAADARAAADRPILKIKLGAKEGDIERVRAVRKAAPDSQLIADANEGWTKQSVQALFAECRSQRYSLIEQPLPAGEDEFLRFIEKPVPLCADESLHDRDGLESLRGIYKYINVKLDKTGGLSEALALTNAAREAGFGIMVGCMVATSLAMAPATLIAMDAEFVDLDGPLLLAEDRRTGLRFQGSLLFPPDSALWG